MFPNKVNKRDRFESLSALVVDDQPAMKTIIRRMLADIGFNSIFTALDGREALEVIEARQIDVVISDWNMPIMNGLELLVELRGSIATENLPFIMITGNVNQADVKKAIQNGVNEYIIKPFTPATLKEKIIKSLESAEIKRAKKASSVVDIPSTDAVDDEVTPEVNEDFFRAIEDSSGNEELMSVLIVDDEPDNITVLTELLKGKYRLQACLNGEDALDICKSDKQPDLILLDIMMPGMNGLDFCSKLKTLPMTEHIPIIFVSTLSEDKYVVKGLSLGAVDYITKPIQPEITLARISTHMKIVEQRKDMISQYDTLTENVRLRDEIERILQHDLRNPLSLVVASSTTLKQQGTYNAQEVNQIVDSASIMNKMLDEQMHIQRLETNENIAQLKKLNAFSMVSKVVYGQKQKCEGKKLFVTYHVDRDINFIGDETLCFNMFTNLFNNAIDASQENAEIEITVERKRNLVSFKIHNQGVIHESIQPRFFDKYVTYGKQKGTGLGTYSAKLTAKAMKGNIDFISTLEQGTTLIVTLNAA